MKYSLKVIITFISSLIITYLIVGYVKSTVFAAIHWIEGVTIWDKLREYYIRTFDQNIIPAIILAVLLTAFIMYVGRKRNRNL
ncbi:hypothetical protein [Clostridium sp. 'White wine YQ']|uniref:hypothetical protein n=1 Tax=Clostridium sp. 'White wine YQ' TaxID=3027474 RepID=UPI002366EA13|nr:hypothetical protein [Clostridium sp. 'White wine YQ']MDD7794144.1 hypothetical protein [Clostridium sp. 'White wine YQ']